MKHGAMKKLRLIVKSKASKNTTYFNWQNLTVRVMNKY